MCPQTKKNRMQLLIMEIAELDIDELKEMDADESREALEDDEQMRIIYLLKSWPIL